MIYLLYGSDYMNYSVLINILFLFVFYSILGWIFETCYIYVKEKRFVNRGITYGPMCTLYGLCAATLTITFWRESNPILVFVGSMIYGTFIQYYCAKFLLYIGKRKWWDYSDKPYNLDGCICLEYSMFWGVIGVFITRIINPFLYLILENISINTLNIIVYPILVASFIDLCVSLFTIRHMTQKELWKTNIFTKEMINEIKHRMKIAYPEVKKKSEEKAMLNVWYLLAIFFVLGFIGDLIEIVFCRFSMGRWMSRSGVIWGQFSLVWGGAFALATVLLHRHKNKSIKWIFIMGSIFGGAFEYLCSVITEYFFDQIYWDYSSLPLNINGRICLLFCCFWGIAAVIYIKCIYPYLINAIRSIPKSLLKSICIFAFCFLILDMIVTNRVQQRYYARLEGIPAQNKIQETIDKLYPDEFVVNRWWNLKTIKNGDKIRIYEEG